MSTGKRSVQSVDIARSNDGKEQDAFEAWAIAERYDMETHPLHWLFLDAKTYAARQGWKAGIEYAAERAAKSAAKKKVAK